MEDYYLVDAKQEYTSYLISTLAPSMCTGFKDLFEQSKKILNGNSVFKNFQILLSNVPNWNDHMLNREVNDITKETGCDWLDNLITAVFVSHSKILTSVKIGNYRPKNKKIDLKIPDTNSFIHQCYIQAAREFYKNPLLFLEDTKLVKPDEILKNQQTAQTIIKESIMTTIRKLLPFRNILNEYLSLENNNNTIYIGNTSVGGSIAQTNVPAITLPAPITLPPPSEQPKQIESSVNSKPLDQSEERTINSVPVKIKTTLPVIEDHPLPDLKQWKKPISPKKLTPVMENDSLSTISSKEEMPIKAPEMPKIQSQAPIEKDDLSISTISSEEKEIKVVGKELNLFDTPAEQEPEQEDDFFDLNSLISVEQPKKIESLDSASLNKFVKNIKEEFNDKEEDSINIDDLSFLQPKQEKTLDMENLSFLQPKKEIEFENVSIQKSKSTNQIVPYVQPKEQEVSIDLEKIKQVLKEDGTIIDQSLVPSNSFALQNITPIIREKEKSIDQSTNRSSKQVNLSNNIKKISIKYNAKVPFKTGQKKKPQRGKTTLVDEAADDDSSEMIFK